MYLLRRALHVIQALNGNKCNTYYVSGKINEFKKRKKRGKKGSARFAYEKTKTKI